MAQLSKVNQPSVQFRLVHVADFFRLSLSWRALVVCSTIVRARARE